MSDTQNVADLPDWAQTLITDLRKESAGHRTSKQDLTTQLTDLTTKVDALTKSLADTEAAKTASDEATQTATTGWEAEKFSRMRDRLAHERGLPANVAELVTAGDEESLTSALDALAALRGGDPTPKPEPNPAQGGTGQLTGDAAKTAAAEEFFDSI